MSEYPADNSDLPSVDIAVVGRACRFPGAHNADEYWRNLRDGVESVSFLDPAEPPGSRAEELVRQSPAYVGAGGFLDGIDRFDAPFFQFTPMDAAIMDPQHRFFLEVAWEALEDAGHPPESFDGSIGVFGGSGMNAYMPLNLFTNPELMDSIGLFLVRHTGNDKDFLTTRVSYCFDLKGPSVNIQTACSTSLVAIHYAAQSLLNQECDMALAGGVTIHLPHRCGYVYKEGEVLSADGHCRPFDADSSGTVFGSGAGIVVLRRLEDALEDGDQIHALIKGSAVNNDGALKVGYLAPSVDGQAEAMAEAIAMADVDPASISYVEAHGTGTKVGDPIEISALQQAFGPGLSPGSCAVGSVKSNIGHCDTAAGVASFIKVLECLKHRKIPSSLYYRRPNPEIDFGATPFFVNDQLREWEPQEGTRRAGVNSLGVGGTNAYVILEEAPAPVPTSESRPWQLLVLSARTRTALDEATRRLARRLSGEEAPSLADVAHTLRVGRRAFPVRRSLVCRDIEQAVDLLESEDRERVHTGKPVQGEPRPVFLFPGGGAQYPTMARGLYESEPVFREEVDRCLEVLKSELEIDLLSLLYPEPDGLEAAAEALGKPSLQLPALFMIEYALARLWQSWGVMPAALLGHSLGENTAGCVAGVFSLEDAVRLVALRGRLMELIEPGAMVSVDLPRPELEQRLPADVSVAAVNAAELCVASGPLDSVEQLEKRLADEEIDFRRIQVAVAAHSPLLEPILDDFGSYLRSIELHAPQIPIVSNLTGTWLTDAEAQDPEYWMKHLRSTVRFADGAGKLLEEPDHVYLEVGPGNVLSTLVRMHPEAGPGLPVFNCLRHRDEEVDDSAFLLGVLGKAWATGAKVDWKRFTAGETRRRVSLDTYAWDHQSYWIEPGEARYESKEMEAPLHRIANLDDWFYAPVWREAGPAQPAAELAQESESSGCWLFFMDEFGLGAELAERLEKRGETVVRVRPGDAFYRFEDGQYAVAPEEPRDYEALLESLLADGKKPDRIVHGWLVTKGKVFRAGSTFLHRNLEHGFYSLLYLFQALGSESWEEGFEVVVLSNGMHRVLEGDVVYPEKSAALGPVRVVPQELFGVRARAIDVDLDSIRRGGEGDTDPLESCFRDLVHGSEDITAHRGETRFRLDYERIPVPAAESPPLRERGVYLITGGLGGIALAQAEALAQTGKQPRLILLGRKGLPARADWDDWLRTHGREAETSRRIRAVRRLEELGATVRVEAADVANVEELQGVIDRTVTEFGAIHGVVHAAGIVDDGVIQEKTFTGVERVFTPKIHGTLLLHQLLASRELDFFVVFSSTSTVLGPGGQVDYVAANCFLNAFAQAHDDPKQNRVTAVEWGIWGDVGMAVELASRSRTAEMEAQGEPASVPLLDLRVKTPQDGVEFITDLEPEDRWILDEHRTGEGRAVVPGTGYLEVACESLAADGQPLQVSDVVFLSPLQVPDGGARRMKVRLEARNGTHAFEISSRELHGKSSEWQLHAQGKVRELDPGDASPPSPLPLGEIESRCEDHHQDLQGLRTAQEKHLRFGPRWRCLREIRYGRGEALARLELSEQFHHDLSEYRLHPALLDLATGAGLPLVEGYDDGENLYVPFAYDTVRVYGSLPARVFSHIRGDAANHAERETASFDITITDEEGRVIVDIHRFTVKRVDRRTVFAPPPVPAAGAAETHLSEEEKFFREMLELGIRRTEGTEALLRILCAPPRPDVIVSSIDLAALREKIRRLSRERSLEPGTRFSRPELESEYVEPRDDIERALVKDWEELLGVDRVGVQDNFFDLGGYSLIAVRLFNRIKKAYDVEYPISVLFEAPTVEKIAEMLRDETGVTATGDQPAGGARRPRFQHLVQLQKVDGTEKPPFFLVAGMFGNIMNLRQLAGHLGPDQPYYGVQARGLFGDSAPHETFQEMARDYLAEIRQVQAEGPYYIGGFSGGGITAYEMAQQLHAEGAEVGILVLLDSILPQDPDRLSAWDKLRIHYWRFVRSRGKYVLDWARRRYRWEKQRWQNRRRVLHEQNAAEFRSEAVGAAFRAACERYDIQPYSGDVQLFRPPLEEAFVLGPGRVVNHEREFMHPLNYWDRVVEGDVHVHEVAGDHDSMVLEPNVRVLGSQLRRCLEDAMGLTPQPVPRSAPTRPEDRLAGAPGA